MTIEPKSKRAKNRVREHGSEMTFVRRAQAQCFGGKWATLLRADDGWLGWLSDEEANVEQVC